MRLLHNHIVCFSKKLAVRGRIRHLHGHGVHSPFAYRFVREVYMKRRCYGECAGKMVYEAIRGKGISRCDASLIQRTYDYAGTDVCLLNGRVIVDAFSQPSDRTARMVVYTPDADIQLLSAEHSAQCGIDVVMYPRKNIARYEICMEAVAGHAGMSIDCRSMILFFHRKGLNKEHIKL